MKKMIVVIGIILISSPAFSGQKEGNGGGIWACKDKWIELVDLYEGREEFHLNISQRSSQSYHEILKEIEGRLSPINEKFGETISRYIADIISSMTFTNAELIIIDDALYRIKPPDSSCWTTGMVTYVQLANFTHYGKTLIQKTIWDDEKFSELGRAALIVHEALYKYARETKKDTNSVRTREAVAYIFSDMKAQNLHKKLLDLELLNSEPPTNPGKCKEGEKRTTTTGAVFTCDRSHAALNEAWRDPDGLIWGDIVKNDDGSVRYMVQSSEYMKEISRPLPDGALGAEEYCESIGARVPWMGEFTRLREYMGARSGTYKGYSAQVLPNLSGYWFWSASVGPDDAYDFYGSNGSLRLDFRVSNLTVRCVVSGNPELIDPPVDPEKRETTTGAIFTRDYSHPTLGEAWRDPDGLIWGDMVKTDGSIQYMNYDAATSYCTSIGARLPSKDEFTRLREYMGARPGTHEGYSPQVLPNLSSNLFWSSSIDSNAPYVRAFFFLGSDSRIGLVNRNFNNAVRCVGR